MIRHKRSTHIFIKTKCLLLIISACIFVFAACGANFNIHTNILTLSPAYAVPSRVPIAPDDIFAPSAGNVYVRHGDVTIDTSNASSGYVMIRYEGSAKRAVARIEKHDIEQFYDFNLNVDGQWDVFTMTHGNGTYNITVFENIQDDMFATVLTTSVEVTLYDYFLPFLHPNQYVNFNSDSRAVALAAELASGAENDLDVVRNIYGYIVSNINYDHDLAANITAGNITAHLPDIDHTLVNRRGICFDYAALMTAMLRAQHIPASLEIGLIFDNVYHAWVSAYISNVGWIRLDPTLSAGASSFGEAQIGSADHKRLFVH